jgi:ligand-binding sensor domain-containing protein
MRRLIIFCVAILLCYSCKKGDNNVNIKQYNSLPYNKINKIYIDKEGIKWIASDSGIVSFNGKVWTRYTESIINNIPIADILVEKSGNNLWIASEKGASEINFTNINFLSTKSFTTKSSGLLSDTVNSIGIDTSNVKYFGTNYGLSIFNGANWDTFYGKTQYGIDSIFKLSPITGIASASNGWVFVSTFGSGVSRFKYQIDAVTGATTYDKNWAENGFKTLNTNNIFTVIVTDDTCQWYGTDKGVAFHNSPNAKSGWSSYTTANGLICDTVLAIAEDKLGNIWFGTFNGVSKFNGKSWQNFLKSDGLIANKVNTIAVDLDGSVWFGTDYGISHYSNNTWTNYNPNL